jgi:hypothetical protein
MRHQRLSFLAAFLVVLLSVPAFAQKITATIRGTVMDPTGAVVAGAKVTVKNEGTGFTRSGATNAAGIYSFQELPVGNYRIEVEQAGFKAEVRSKIAVSAADIRAVDVQLQTGEVTEVVDVEVSGLTVKTTGADVSGLITGDTARELPLNGRNFMQLTFLQPGVVAQEGMNSRDKGLTGGSDISVSGGSTQSNLWMVDGANNNDVGSNRTILVYPSVDAIEEFKLQRNNYGAEFGQAGGAQVNLITRGGSNEWHGSAYYYARRDKFNSTDYFLKQSGQEKAPLKWDDFGGTFGGPIIKDKLHFFWSQEWNKDKRSDVRTSQVPTAAERNGDFSQSPAGCSPPAPIDPRTGAAFPGGIIPTDRLSPGGQLMLKNMPLPNVTPSGGSCQNWIEAVSTPTDWRQENARLDWTVSNSTRIMLRYTQDSWVAKNSPSGTWGDDPFPVVASDWNQPGKSLVAQLNQNIGSSMVNSLTFSYSANKIEVVRGGTNPELATQLAGAIPTLFASSVKQKAGAAMPMANWGSLGDYGGGVLWNQAPWLNNQDLFVVKDDFSAVFGKHFVKIGGLASYNKKNEEYLNASQESVAVNGLGAGWSGTGNVIADWVLADTVWNATEFRNNPNVQQRWKDLEFYIADTYKVNSRVSADFGVRLTHFTWPYEANDNISSFDPASASAALGDSPCNGLLFPTATNPCSEFGLQGGTQGPNRGLVPTKAVLVAPRLGVAWDVFGTGKTSIRGGLGVFYARERLSAGLGLGVNPPFGGTSTVDRRLASNTPLAGTTDLSFGAPSSGLEQDSSNPSNWQWNVSLQHELMKNTVLEVAYVGNRGQNLRGQRNANEVAPANRLAYARSGSASLRPLGNIAGIGNGAMTIETHDRKSQYHGLQTSLVSRFGRASQASLSYSLSTSKADTALHEGELTAMDSTNLALDYSRTGVDKRHVFAGTVVLMLPTFEEKGSFARHVLGDWQVTGIAQASSGYPISVTLGGVSGLSGGLNGAANDNQRPDRVADQPCRASGGSEIQWLNPAAFTINGHTIGTNGNSPRGVCNGPGFFQVDAAVYKNIKVNKKVTLQLRAEVFNLFDRANFRVGNSLVMNWNPENAVFDTGDAATATRVISATPGGGFGQLNDAADAREVQLGIRLSF